MPNTSSATAAPSSGRTRQQNWPCTAGPHWHGWRRNWVKNAVRRVEGLYQQAGSYVEAFRLRGLDPRERAWKHWARLRKADVDPQSVSTTEFKRVQAAKLVRRMASGTHKRWEREQADAFWSRLRTKTVVEEKHWYSRSRGRVLRYIGEDLEGAVELLVEHHRPPLHCRE